MEMRELVAWLNQKAYEYYTMDNPTVSDVEYDRKYDELVAMERETGIRLPDSPTRRVGGAVLKEFVPHTHLAKLWSMGKAQSEGEILDWAARCEKANGKHNFVVEHKFDGLTINLTYDNGELVQAATRGNGEVGEAILPQALTIKTIPLCIPFKGKMEVHGEGYMRLSRLAKYNETAKEPLKNARNAAAGALRNLDPSVTEKRHLDACFYDIGYIEGKSFADQGEMIAFLKENGFQTPATELYAETIEQALEFVRQIGEQRNTLDYLIDGAVIKIRDFAARRELGYTDKFPRWAIAFKFEAEEITSVLEDVTWELGRTGKLTPLAHVSPVELCGATVQKATLNNYGDILRKGVKKGARVWIRRSNEVIPEITGTAAEGDEGTEITKPTRCPACGSLLEERGAHLFCPNRDGCKPQIVMRLSFFASREAMDIDTFSEKTAAQLFDEMGICEVWQLYCLDKDKLVSLDRFGEKKAHNLLDAIEKSKIRPLDAFILAIGIPNIGVKTARDLALRFGSMEALSKADEETLTAMDDVGEIVAKGIIEFFKDSKNTEMIQKLFELGVAPVPLQKNEGGPLHGMTVVVTGTLATMDRHQAESAVVNAGGKSAGSVSKKTSLVVAGENAGSKLTKANQLGVRVIGEEEFLRLLKGE